jgi:threonine dehydratase
MSISEKNRLTGAPPSWDLAQSYTQIKRAAERIQDYVRHTPTMLVDHFHNPLYAHHQLFLKLDHMQITGSFKPRGVFNRVLSAPKELLEGGLLSASGGNHGQAVAYVAHKMNLPATIFVPKTTPQLKIDRIAAWGSEVVIFGNDMGESIDHAQTIAHDNGKLFVHPFADPEVIYGQGTMALEVFAAVSNLDAMVVAIGGGGMISGVSIVAKTINPKIKIYGVEPEGCPTLYNSIKAGHIVPVKHINTRAGTLAVKETQPLNFSIVHDLVDEIILVSDAEMQRASTWLWDELSIAAELSGAASMAGLLSAKLPFNASDRICAIICGTGLEGIQA